MRTRMDHGRGDTIESICVRSAKCQFTVPCLRREERSSRRRRARAGRRRRRGPFDVRGERRDRESSESGMRHRGGVDDRANAFVLHHAQHARDVGELALYEPDARTVR